MIWLFKSTAASSIAIFAVLLAVFVLGLMDIIPFYLELLGIAACFGLEVLVVFWSLKKYSDLIDIANTDPERFFAENRKLIDKSKGKWKTTTLGNEIVILIYYCRISQAEQALAGYAQMIRPDDIVGRFQYANFYMTIDILKKDFSKMDRYINDKRVLLSQITASGDAAVTPRLKETLALTSEQNILEAEFYSRPVERLRNEDRQLALRFLESTLSLMGRTDSMKVMKKLSALALDYQAGVIYAVLGDEQNAEVFLKRAADTGYAYPMVEKAARYLQDRDIQALMSSQLY